jgi:hypothetical protein
MSPERTIILLFKIYGDPTRVNNDKLGFFTLDPLYQNTLKYSNEAWNPSNPCETKGIGNGATHPRSTPNSSTQALDPPEISVQLKDFVKFPISINFPQDLKNQLFQTPI